MVKNTQKLQWYDLKLKKKWTPTDYTVKTSNGKRYGLAKNPKSGVNCSRMLGKKK